jgi:hypothetical protein
LVSGVLGVAAIVVAKRARFRGFHERDLRSRIPLVLDKSRAAAGWDRLQYIVAR